MGIVNTGFILDGSDDELPQHHPNQKPRCEENSDAEMTQVPRLCGVPVELLPRDLATTLHTQMNNRLARAQAENVDLCELKIGNDCLPTWPNLEWDPDCQSLHEVLQERLQSHALANDLGNMVTKAVVSEGEKKLQEAINQGIELDAITIGDSLVPEWCTDESCTEDGDGSGDDSCAPADDLGVYHQEHVTGGACAEEPSVDDGTAPMSLATDSDSDSETDMEIELNNDVATDPIYEETDGNVVHDVDICSGTEWQLPGDVEVSLVTGYDSDFDNMPEIELSIDREGYVYHYGDEQAVDVTIPGTDIFCFSGIEEVDDESVGHSDGELAIADPEESQAESYSCPEVIDIITRGGEADSDESCESDEE